MRLRIKRAQFFARPILRGFGVFAAGFDETFLRPRRQSDIRKFFVRQFSERAFERGGERNILFCAVEIAQDLDQALDLGVLADVVFATGMPRRTSSAMIFAARPVLLRESTTMSL